MKKIILSILLVISNNLFAQNLSQKDLWQLLQQKDHFAMIRHAYAPGFGDPDNFDVNIRSTQRNLNVVGEKQAKAMGDLFRKNGISKAEIYSSYWFRCYETAVLMGLGKVQKFEGLNSFFQDHYDESKVSNELKLWLQRKKSELPLILVTHQVNITNLTNYFPDSGEIVVVKKLGNNRYEVAGTIPTR